jgi:hypothetical protein
MGEVRRLERDDPIGTARGCLLGLLLGAILWVIIGGAIWLALFGLHHRTVPGEVLQDRQGPVGRALGVTYGDGGAPAAEWQAALANARRVSLAELAYIESQGFIFPDHGMAVWPWMGGAYTAVMERPVTATMHLPVRLHELPGHLQWQAAHEAYHVLASANGWPQDEHLGEQYVLCYGSTAAREHGIRYYGLVPDCAPLEKLTGIKSVTAH